jgi:hypothetical protein
MSDQQNPFELAATALASIDTSPHQTRLAEIDAEQARMDAAISSAEAQIEEKFRQISQARISGPNGSAAAAALLAGDDVMAAAPTIEMLEAERATLSAGLTELRRSRNNQSAARETQRQALRGELGKAVEPAAAELWQRARAAAEELGLVFAGASAIAQATGNDSAGRLKRQLGAVLGKLAGDGYEAGICRRTDLAVPDEVRSLLDGVRSAIEFSHGRIPTSVSFPME